MQDVLYRIWAQLRHRLTAWHTGGGGIHSPYLFYLVRMLMYDDNSYYCWDRIEERRRAMLRAQKEIEVEDWGTGRSRERRRRVCEIARGSLEKSRNVRILFRWLRFLGEGRGGGLNIVELGTSLGITTAYLASVGSKNKVITFEGSGAIADMAKMNWDKLGIANIQQVVGNIDETLSPTLACASACANNKYNIDMAFIDANHTYEATMRYWRELVRYKGDKSIYVVDDIHYSREMERAWNEIKAREEVSSSMDLGDMGVLFFDKQYMKKHYRLRV